MEIKEILYKIRTVFLYSLFTASIVGFFEVLAGYYGISLARYAFYVLDYFPFLKKDLLETEFPQLLMSLLFAVYLITISGWMFSYMLTNKGILKYLPTILILVLTFYSGSRTALIVIFIQVIIFFLTTVSKEKIIKNTIRATVVFSFLTVCIFIFNGDKIINAFEEKIDSLDFRSNLTKNISNQSRFGMQYAALRVFLEHPIIGVGYGQQTYYSRFHYPAGQ
ncbi:O-antigen ligase family protein [Flavobacterium lindanitolerans]|nr:O-antigen ligase family protein [Flavobacterium lindanitolerans]